MRMQVRRDGWLGLALGGDASRLDWLFSHPGERTVVLVGG
jgi:hypothetical protein